MALCEIDTKIEIVPGNKTFDKEARLYDDYDNYDKKERHTAGAMCLWDVSRGGW